VPEQAVITDHAITAAMIRYGGSFCALLGRLYRAADPVNQARIRDAFPDYWAEYRILARIRADQDDPQKWK
jgi:hypothetical protein